MLQTHLITSSHKWLFCNNVLMEPLLPLNHIFLSKTIKLITTSRETKTIVSKRGLK